MLLRSEMNQKEFKRVFNKLTDKRKQVLQKILAGETFLIKNIGLL
jgi:FixJ family two-component response regulator